MTAKPVLAAAPALPDVSFAEMAFHFRVLAGSEAAVAANMEHFIATLAPERTLALRRLLADQRQQAERVGLCVQFCEAIAARESEVRAVFDQGGDRD